MYNKGITQPVVLVMSAAINNFVVRSVVRRFVVVDPTDRKYSVYHIDVCEVIKCNFDINFIIIK